MNAYPRTPEAQRIAASKAASTTSVMLEPDAMRWITFETQRTASSSTTAAIGASVEALCSRELMQPLLKDRKPEVLRIVPFPHHELQGASEIRNLPALQVLQDVFAAPERTGKDLLDCNFRR